MKKVFAVVMTEKEVELLLKTLYDASRNYDLRTSEKCRRLTNKIGHRTCWLTNDFQDRKD